MSIYTVHSRIWLSVVAATTVIGIFLTSGKARSEPPKQPLGESRSRFEVDPGRESKTAPSSAAEQSPISKDAG